VLNNEYAVLTPFFQEFFGGSGALGQRAPPAMCQVGRAVPSAPSGVFSGFARRREG